MPSFDLYKKTLNNTNGQVRKNESDLIMEYTWDEDIATRLAYFYDQEHDDEFEVVDDLHPESTDKIPISIKFIEIEYNSLSKDEVAFHIQFKPSHVPCIPYYKEKFITPYKAHYPIGLYCDIPDNTGVYHRWLVVGQYREYATQFPTWLVLPCDFKAQWIYKNKKYESWGVLRSQSSYNSGEWLDNKIASPENQKILWLPMNDISSTLFYNQRMIISEPIEEPITWKCTKVENMNVRGINRLTFAQDRFDQHKDYIEKDDDGYIVGMWADYYSDGVPPSDADTSNIYCKISYPSKPVIKVGGSYKKLTVNFYKDDELVDYIAGIWSYAIDGVDATDLIEEKIDGLEDNEIKIKFIGSDEYISKILDVTFTTEDTTITTSLELSILGL